MTNRELFEMEPLEMLSYLMRATQVALPESLDSAEAMGAASRATLKLGGYQAYLEGLLGYAKCMVREAKRNCTTEEWQDMVDRKEVVERGLKSTEAEYLALSRAATMEMDSLRRAQFDGRVLPPEGAER